MEQQLAARLAEWQIAKLVDDDEVIAQQLLGKASTSASGLLLFELIDQIDKIEEARKSDKDLNRLLSKLTETLQA